MKYYIKSDLSRFLEKIKNTDQIDSRARDQPELMDFNETFFWEPD